ncbi:GapS6a family protein [Psychrobacter cibarius]|uniref:GapS6a family protein n=1 Tax=Psychrobacter cibarius TaxID=282669 RepID=UPI003FD66DE8
MEYLTATMLSGVTYDLVKSGIKISAESLRNKLRSWLISDEELRTLATHLNQVKDIERLDKLELAKRIEDEPTIHNILINAQQDKSVNKNATLDNSVNETVQNHSGTGHNISGNVTFNNSYK